MPDHLDAPFRQTGAGNETDITGANDCDLQAKLLNPLAASGLMMVARRFNAG